MSIGTKEVSSASDENLRLFCLPFSGVFLQQLANDYNILIIKEINVLKLRKLTAL